MGAPTNSLLAIVPATNCVGPVDSKVRMDEMQPNVLKVSGWAWDTRNHRAPVALAAVSNGAISGWGAVGGWRPSVRSSHRGITNSYIGFTGYVHEGDAPATIKLYAVLPGNPSSACPLADINEDGTR